METRALSGGGLETSALGFGCMGLSHGYATTPDEAEGVRVIVGRWTSG